MMDFMAKMHQIRFRPGLRPRAPAGGAYSAHRPPSCISGPTSKGRVGEGCRGERGERSHCSCFTCRGDETVSGATTTEAQVAECGVKPAGVKGECVTVKVTGNEDIAKKTCYCSSNLCNNGERSAFLGIT